MTAAFLAVQTIVFRGLPPSLWGGQFWPQAASLGGRSRLTFFDPAAFVKRGQTT
jgi:hypothetical protein